jgi:hypothetical protein
VQYRTASLDTAVVTPPDDSVVVNDHRADGDTTLAQPLPCVFDCGLQKSVIHRFAFVARAMQRSTIIINASFLLPQMRVRRCHRNQTRRFSQRESNLDVL